MKFYKLAIGAWFFHVGKRFQKVAMSCEEDERSTGYAFPGGSDIEPDGERLSQ